MAIVLIQKERGLDMASSSIFIYELIASNKIVATDIYNLLKSFPEDESSYFNIQLLGPNELFGEYVIVQNVEETYYNAELRSFEKRIAPRANVIHFDIFNNQLEIWGNKTSANRLVFTLSNSVNQISINAIEFSLKEIVQRLQYKKVKISKVCFEDFLFTEDIVGNFSVDLSSYGNAFSVLQKYQDKISRMTIILPNNDTSLKISLTAKGSVTVYKSRDMLDDEAITMLHNILLK